ncbi:hypothetical protein D081_2062 [Anaerovibrio sp. JC8]|nr:hypothetical protein D081_2062 [Anaerovibrio sp. JC8]
MYHPFIIRHPKAASADQIVSYNKLKPLKLLSFPQIHDLIV